MNHSLLGIAALAASLVLPAAAGDAEGLVVRASRHTVQETMNRLEAAIREASPDYKVFARVDFQDLAAAHGKVRPAQVLIFGRGSILPALLPMSPSVAIDLPLKVLTWEEADGTVRIAYNAGSYLARRHAISGKDELLQRVTDVTAKLVAKAAD